MRGEARMHRFATGEIHSAVIINVFDDGVPGADFHIENARDKAILLRHLEALTRQLKTKR
jgi:hypothetical protein